MSKWWNEINVRQRFKEVLAMHDTKHLRERIGVWVTEGVRTVEFRSGTRLDSMPVTEAIELTAQEILRREELDAGSRLG